jgi:hypothetical protein
VPAARPTSVVLARNVVSAFVQVSSSVEYCQSYDAFRVGDEESDALATRPEFLGFRGERDRSYFYPPSRLPPLLESMPAAESTLLPESVPPSLPEGAPLSPSKEVLPSVVIIASKRASGPATLC